MKQEELEFQRKVEITIKTIFILFFKIILTGCVLLIIIAIATNNSALVYPTYEKTNEMLIQIFVLGILGRVIIELVKKYIKKKD